MMDVRHDSVVNIQLHFASIKHFCLCKMKDDIGFATADAVTIAVKILTAVTIND